MTTPASNDPTGHVLVVEDNAATAENLALFLGAAGHTVTHAADGSHARFCLRVNSYDLVLLDLMLPDVDGMTLCREIRAAGSAPVIMLTARSDEADIVDGLQAGADDYVCKPFGSRELLARVARCLARAVAPRENDQQLIVGNLALDRARREVSVAGRALRLTRSEFDLLAVLMAQPGRVFTRDQLIDAALGRDFDGVDRTVDTHIWSLRKKLGEPRGKPRRILSEPGIGYRLNDAPD